MDLQKTSLYTEETYLCKKKPISYCAMWKREQLQKTKNTFIIINFVSNERLRITSLFPHYGETIPFVGISFILTQKNTIIWEGVCILSQKKQLSFIFNNA